MDKVKTVLRKVPSFFVDNMVVVIFAAFTIAGFLLSGGIPVVFFINELLDRVFRNSFLVLALIIPVVAGLGLNFGIVVGAMAGQLAIIFVRFHEMGGLPALFLSFLLATPLAALFGWLTGMLYNKVRGQEMIASLIVGFFAQGVYNFILLFAVGIIIPVPADNPIIKMDGVGVRMTVDLGSAAQGGMRGSLDNILRMPFLHFVCALSLFVLAFWLFPFLKRKFSKNTDTTASSGAKNAKIPVLLLIKIAACVIVFAFALILIFSGSQLLFVRRVPLVTTAVIIAVGFFINFLNKTKLGQDFRSVGNSQHIAEVSGINVDRTRIIATIFSTVFAAWGMIIFLQNMGTLVVYDAHRNIGLFSVAAILVGGASTSRASVKNAIIGVALFHAMTIVSPELGQALFGDPAAGEYFRSFMVYGIIGLALGLYVWKARRGR